MTREELLTKYPHASESFLKRNSGAVAPVTAPNPPPAIHKRHKYCAKATTVDGITFASKKEANRYVQLKALEKAGEIYWLKLQPEYPIVVNGTTVCKYVADFEYKVNQQFVVEDVKGYRTPIYRLKKKLFESAYAPLTITEV